MLCYVMLYCIMLCYVMLYCIMLCYCYIVLCYVMLFQILAKNQEQCYIRRPSLMATTVATSSAKTMAVAMAVAICTATGWKKPMGARVMATLVAKNAGKYMAGVKPRGGKFNSKISAKGKSSWHHTWQRKRQTCIAGKRKSNKACKVMAKIVARAKDRTRKSKCEITGKSRPRRHIAWPHDIVCSRWLAQAASDIVLYEEKVTIFNQMVVA